MTERRLALVVATDQYDNAGLRVLAAPVADAEALCQVLGDPALGGFDVQVVYNADAATVRRRIDNFLSDAKPDDFVLLHFSCHGLKDEIGELHLAARDTVPNRLVSTAVDAALVNRLMQRSRARRAVLLLDCCYGGAFDRGVVARAGGDVDVGGQFAMGLLGGGRGRVIITASNAMEYAFEGTTLSGVPGAGVQPSVFTSAVAEGLLTGEADRDNDGLVELGELYDYIYDYVRERTPNQTPCKWEFGIQGDLYIARNPRRRVRGERIPAKFASFAELVGHTNVDVRMAAVQVLHQAATGDDLPRAAAARLALEELTGDRVTRVAAAATRALDETGLALSASLLDLGSVVVGATVTSSPVTLTGPPLVRESRIVSVSDKLNVAIDGPLFTVGWTPTQPGPLDASVVIAGPAGERRLLVYGRASVPSVEEPVPVGGRSSVVRTTVILAVMLIGLALIAVLVVAIGVNWFTAPANPVAGPTPVSAAPSVSGSAAGPKEGTANEIEPVGVEIYDESGDRDNAGRAVRIIDGNPDTAWNTFTYKQGFPALKPGVGPVISFGQQVQLSDLIITSPSAGTIVQIRSCPSPGSSFPDTTLIAEAELQDGQTTVSLTGSQPVQYLLIWITRLGGSPGELRTQINEVAAHGSAT